ncbi:DUF4345 domain-containing protein [Neolewinella antarctica]|uniref:DUF4345 domain-containing protein n=1 Tax=Neolewinella antarctica TaxID=442734 RepID=A0ABX0XD43_9BACT|nr:DUF4345 domain-containing protein [Neolewinella antarctica]NJC27219.1 hypothetical protein [Neolewinella antarctica]
MNERKNYPLITAVVLIIPIALGYGLNPELADGIFAFGFDFVADTPDQKNIFRAISGLYLGMVGLWWTGIRNPAYWHAATVSLAVFMLGLAAGRILSFLVDGLPSINFIGGTVAEILLGVWAVQSLRTHQNNN